MQIKSTNKLNEKEIKSIEKLLTKVNNFDGTYREPYLDNDYNFDKNMPAFFMAYNDLDDLIGILATYADSKDVEIQLKIDSDYRRKKIATHLYKTFLKETKEYDLNTVSFVTEEVFLDNNPDIIKILI